MKCNNHKVYNHEKFKLTLSNMLFIKFFLRPLEFLNCSDPEDLKGNVTKRNELGFGCTKVVCSLFLLLTFIVMYYFVVQIKRLKQDLRWPYLLSQDKPTSNISFPAKIKTTQDICGINSLIGI